VLFYICFFFNKLVVESVWLNLYIVFDVYVAVIRHWTIFR